MDTAGNLFIADFDNFRIRKVTPGGVISTVAGNGTQGFSGDGGPATSAQLYSPTGVAVDTAGNLFIADLGNSRIRKVTGVAFASAFFPDVAVGGGWSTAFTLGNTGSTLISGTLLITDQQGSPLNVNSPSLGAGSSFPVSIPPGGTTFLTVSSINSNDPTKSGWATVETTGGVPNGVATFQFFSGATLQNAASVLSSQPMQFATIPVDDNYSQNRLTAYAVANPTSQTVVIKLGLVDVNGNLVNDTVSITLTPGQQIARYLYQDLGLPIFQGSMVLRAQCSGTFIAVALVQNQQLFTVIPVTPSKASNIPN